MESTIKTVELSIKHFFGVSEIEVKSQGLDRRRLKPDINLDRGTKLGKTIALPDYKNYIYLTDPV